MSCLLLEFAGQYLNNAFRGPLGAQLEPRHILRRFTEVSRNKRHLHLIFLEASKLYFNEKKETKILKNHQRGLDKTHFHASIL
jgi:hypothetical protein